MIWREAIECRDAVAHAAGQPLTIDDLITHTKPLDDSNHAFELMHAGGLIRSVALL